MRRKSKASSLVVELRKIIGKSQSQFAAMIGVSKHAIISVENARNDLSQNMAKHIEIATGAKLLGGKLESPFRADQYTRDDFDCWRGKYGQTNKTAALKQLEEMKTWLKIIFLAAAKSGRAGNRDRLPAVCLSLVEWLNETRVKFKLEDEVEDILDEETRASGVVAHTISSLLEEPDRSTKKLAEHDINFAQIKKELKAQAKDGFLFIQDEYRNVWLPGQTPFQVPARPRKLIPKAKFWIKKFQPTDLATFKETGNSHPELWEYLKKLENESP